jgi:hypothetical protein
MGGWVGGWVAGKAGLRIAYSNQKIIDKDVEMIVVTSFVSLFILK